MIEFDRNFVVTAWGPSAERVLGWTAREAVGRPTVAVMPPCEGRAKRRARLAALLRDGRWSGVSLSVDKAGRLIAVATQVVATPTGYRSRVRDVSSQLADKTPQATGDPSRDGDWHTPPFDGESPTVSTVTASDETLARNIRRARRDAGLSQTALGDAIGVSFKRIGDYEHARHRPSHWRIDQIADATGRKPSWFYDEHEDANDAE